MGFALPRQAFGHLDGHRNNLTVHNRMTSDGQDNKVVE